MVPRFWNRFSSPQTDHQPADNQLSPTAVQQCMNALREIFAMARTAGAKVIVLQHWTPDECAGKPLPGHDLILETCKESGVPVYQLADWYRPAIRQGCNPFRDGIHLNDLGQRLMASAMYELIRNPHWPARWGPEPR